MPDQEAQQARRSLACVGLVFETRLGPMRPCGRGKRRQGYKAEVSATGESSKGAQTVIKTKSEPEQGEDNPSRLLEVKDQNCAICDQTTCDQFLSFKLKTKAVSAS
ncbi:hypothetical protein CIHG_05099 [Coccidioides immitis H538.4]|uniref:Uncharacterized protein n=1 Tax=Coccidioides immitis H538.4 TaxID=396776 RepID=A0A0J8UIA2_COCIT|nr:hypothetical protein CIHG_05099 [Coccidioides immitis H538.4]